MYVDNVLCIVFNQMTMLPLLLWSTIGCSRGLNNGLPYRERVCSVLFVGLRERESRGVCGVTDNDTHTLLINATHRSECTHVHDKLVYVPYLLSTSRHIT